MGADFSDHELADYRAATGGAPVAFRIAHASIGPRALSGPLAIFVRADNPLTSLTLTATFGPAAPMNLAALSRNRICSDVR